MKDKHTDVQNKWKQNCIMQKMIEVIGIVIIISLLTMGSIFDLLKIHVLIVEDLSSISLTALQIQASISAISIALVALLSGSVSEEYYGISVSHYFLNIKPFLFKQNRIIIGSICLVAINIGAHILGAYNLVIAILWVSCVLIIISVVEIYSAFIGKRNTSDEIEMYLDYILLDISIPFEKKADIFSNYIGYWATLNQNKVDYENEKERYEKAIGALLGKNPEETLKLLQSTSSDLVKKFLSVSEAARKYRAFEIFKETYDQVWLFILRNNLQHLETEFDLYFECAEDMIHGIYELSLNDLERTVHWELLIDTIFRVNIYCHGKEKSDILSLFYHVEQFEKLPDSVGEALAERRKKGERINPNYWKRARNLMFTCNANIPDIVEDNYKKAKRQLELAFYCSLVKHDQQDIAYTFLENYSVEEDNDKYSSVAFMLLIICYTYYLAERESLECVSCGEKNSSKKILEKFKKNNIYANMIYDICGQNNSINYEMLYDELRTVLDHYERMRLDGTCKICIMDDVVKDFMLLFMVLSNAYGMSNDSLDRFITNEKAFSWYASYLGDKIESTEKLLVHILQTISAEDKTILEMLERGLGEFNDKVLNKYKVQSMLNARKEYTKFLEKNKDGVFLKGLETSIEKHLREKCEIWFDVPDKCYTMEQFHLLEFTTQVNFLERIKKDIIPNVESNFIHILMERLYKLNRLDLFVREKSNEDEYFNLVSNKAYVLIGPGFAFNPYEYKRREEFDQLTNRCGRINLGIGSRGILLTERKIPIGIDKVSISIHHKSIKDVRYRIDTATGMYRYSPTSETTLPYTKEELEEYLYNKYIVLDVTIRLNIMNPNTKCGYIIERKRRTPN